MALASNTVADDKSKDPFKHPDEGKYDRDPPGHYEQLNTENDQSGFSTVKAIYRPRKEVCGQPAVDMKQNPVNWAELGIIFKNRPSPFDFPAFENQKNERTGNAEKDEETLSQVQGAGDKQGSTEKVKPETVTATKTKTKTNATAMSEDKTQVSRTLKLEDEKAKKKQSSETKKRKKKTKRTDENSGPKGVNNKSGNKVKKLSHNADLDDCSLENEN